MCISCHKGLSDEIITVQLQEALKNPEFDVWNETSLSHMAICIVGYNGIECRIMGNQLLEEYIQWKSQKLFKSTYDMQKIVIATKLYNRANEVYHQKIEGHSLSKEEIMHAWSASLDANPIFSLDEYPILTDNSNTTAAAAMCTIL